MESCSLSLTHSPASLSPPSTQQQPTHVHKHKTKKKKCRKSRKVKQLEFEESNESRIGSGRGWGKTDKGVERLREIGGMKTVCFQTFSINCPSPQQQQHAHAHKRSSFSFCPGPIFRFLTIWLKLPQTFSLDFHTTFHFSTFFNFLTYLRLFLPFTFAFFHFSTFIKTTLNHLPPSITVFAFFFFFFFFSNHNVTLVKRKTCSFDFFGILKTRLRPHTHTFILLPAPSHPHRTAHAQTDSHALTQQRFEATHNASAALVSFKMRLFREGRRLDF